MWMNEMMLSSFEESSLAVYNILSLGNEYYRFGFIILI